MKATASEIQAAALCRLDELVRELLPDGQLNEHGLWTAPHPGRSGRVIRVWIGGSRPGAWTECGKHEDVTLDGRQGGDLVGLAALLGGVNRAIAGERLAERLGLAG